MNFILKMEIIRGFGSQANFAQSVGVNEVIVSRVIHGRHTLRPEDREKWAKALGREPEDLFDS